MKLLCFLTFGFFQNVHFFRLRRFISPSTYPISSIFPVVVCIYKNHVSYEVCFLSAIVGMITENMFFPISTATVPREKSLHQIMQLINPDYPWKIRNQIMFTEVKSSQRCILWPMTKVRDPSKWISIFYLFIYFFIHIFTYFYFYYHLLSHSSNDLICCFTCLIFPKSSWWQAWTNCSNPPKLSNEFTKDWNWKKKRKIFCGPPKLFKSVSWPINVCLKHFMTSSKTLRRPFLHT